MSQISIVLGNDPPPKYNWFGAFDYGWFDDNLGGLSSVPFFEAVPEQLAQLLRTSSARQQLRISLVPGDCETVSGSHNCTEACSNPSSLFTPPNLRVCTALAGAALLVQNGTYSVDRSDAQTVEAINSWQIPELSTYNGAAVFNHIAQCIPQSCTFVRLGECAKDVRDLATVEINASNLAVISSRLGRYCDAARLEINADIAGPGVLLSYFFQTSIVFLFFLLLKISKSWVRRLCIPFKWLSNQENDEFQDKLSEVQNKLARSRPGVAVTSSLVEFQEVQIYFITSVQIAMIIAYNPDLTDTVGANNNSYAAVILNSGLAAFLNISSMGCILLAQCCLHRAGMRWWYIFTIMTISFILAIAIFGLRNNLMPPVEALWKQFKDDAPLPLCGNNPSPMTYCGPSSDTSFLDNSVIGYLICGLGSAAWVGLFIDQLVFTLRTRRTTLGQGIARSLDRHGGMLREKSKMWSVLGSTYWFTVQTLLFLLVGYHNSQLVLILEYVSIGDISKWSFGQLIAVMVWAPTIIKCLYFNIFGVQGGFEERIPNEYRIIRESESKSSDEPSAQKLE